MAPDEFRSVLKGRAAKGDSQEESHLTASEKFCPLNVKTFCMKHSRETLSCSLLQTKKKVVGSSKARRATGRAIGLQKVQKG